MCPFAHPDDLFVYFPLVLLDASDNRDLFYITVIAKKKENLVLLLRLIHSLVPSSYFVSPWAWPLKEKAGLWSRVFFR